MAENISSIGKKNIATEAKQDQIIVILSGINEKSIVDDTTTVNVTYIGYAAISSDESAAVWKIKKLDETSGILITLWADGNANYDNIWADRATTIIYS